MNKIKTARLRARMTAVELAKAVEMSPGAISKIERGLMGVRPRNAKKLAEVLGMDVTEVLFPEEKAA